MYKYTYEDEYKLARFMEYLDSGRNRINWDSVRPGFSLYVFF